MENNFNLEDVLNLPLESLNLPEKTLTRLQNCMYRKLLSYKCVDYGQAGPKDFTVRSIFEFGLDEIASTSGLGAGTISKICEGLTNLGLDYATLDGQIEKLKDRKPAALDAEDLFERLKYVGVSYLTCLKPERFDKGSESMETIKQVCTAYFDLLEENLKEATSADEESYARYVIETQKALFEKIVSNKRDGTRDLTSSETKKLKAGSAKRRESTHSWLGKFHHSEHMARRDDPFAGDGINFE